MIIIPPSTLSLEESQRIRGILYGAELLITALFILTTSISFVVQGFWVPFWVVLSFIFGVIYAILQNIRAQLFRHESNLEEQQRHVNWEKEYVITDDPT